MHTHAAQYFDGICTSPMHSHVCYTASKPSSSQCTSLWVPRSQKLNQARLYLLDLYFALRDPVSPSIGLLLPDRPHFLLRDRCWTYFRHRYLRLRHPVSEAYPKTYTPSSIYASEPLTDAGSW